jgi:hypothetical protein
MADLAVTASSVAIVRESKPIDGTSGAAVTAGQPCYRGSDGKWYPALAGGNGIQSGSLGLAIAANSAPGANQPLRLFGSGTINVGATLTVGEQYGVSTNAGKISPMSDLGSGKFISFLGVGTSNTNLATPSSGAFATNTNHA